MANPERDTVYDTDTTRTTYVRESSGTGWFVGIIVALALLAIGYLVFSANSGTSTAVDGAAAPAAVTEPAAEPAMTAPAPAIESAPPVEATPAPAAPATDAAPAAGAPVAP
ncbi:hypothetical protein [Devosia sp. 1566]|uniref:hypothetical protein n=1 Tax=Devosia sp. 1566 TaxID=2499144 RepID=UPI000FD93F66|nr:hypothetical protein [Devosia sp. 1566]